MPIILIVFVVVIAASSLGSAFTAVSSGGEVAYNETAFGDYANDQYAVEFSDSTAYEDNLMLVFLVEDDEYYDYYYISWKGDHINEDIVELFGNEYTAYGKAINSKVNSSSYKYSLDSDLASVINAMGEKVASLELTTSFTCNEEHVGTKKSHLVNNTSLPLTESTVNAALEKFTEDTGIPVVLVVEDIDDVFERTMPVGAIFTIILLIAIVALAIYLIVRSVKKRKQYGENDNQYYN